MKTVSLETAKKYRKCSECGKKKPYDKYKVCWECWHYEMGW